MKFKSTRNSSEPLLISQAMLRGLAPDGGLYVPEGMPMFGFNAFIAVSSIAELGPSVLRPFFSGDPLLSQLQRICEKAFSFEIPLRDLDLQTSILELFHGPTAAFKDVGARFLAECLELMPSSKNRTVIVATSGDTGGAVASAFFRRPGFEVVILFPKGKVSPRQEKQLTCWGENVKAFAVLGDFDDCQRLAKEVLAGGDWANRTWISANSISIGRLLPQTLYYALGSFEYYRKKGVIPGFVVPSGNLGNGLAAVWAKVMGFPIREVCLATNANRSVPDYFETGAWTPRPTVPTIANAMDVGNPSNMERLLHFFPNQQKLKAMVKTMSVSDKEITNSIVQSLKDWNVVICPHTAAAAHARRNLAGPWIIAATAHPAKFESIIEPLIGRKPEIPEELAELLKKKSEYRELKPELSAFKALL